MGGDVLTVKDQLKGLLGLQRHWLNPFPPDESDDDIAEQNAKHLKLAGNQQDAERCEDDGDEEHVHKYFESVVKPTCTEQGYTVMECECGSTISVLRTK